MKSVVNRTLSVGQEHELLQKLEAAGLNTEDADRVTSSRGNKLAKAIVAFIRGGTATGTTQERARQIMGRNFHGIDQVEQHFGAYVDQQVSALETVPFSEDVLEACKDTHILVAGFPHTLLDIRRKVRKGLFWAYDNAWYNQESFATDKQVGLRWYLIRKDIVPNSASKTYAEQCKLLGQEEETLRACELAHGIMLHFLVTGERLFECIYARCSDLGSGGYRVYLGYFDENGLNVYSYWADNQGSGLGLASARKL